ncbi:MAG: hypothetical protein V1827_00580 [Candidatus Micrarchaeota archaeon]
MAQKNLLPYSLAAFFLLTTVVSVFLFMQSSAENNRLGAELAGTKNDLATVQDNLAAARSTIDERNREISLQQNKIENLTLDLSEKNSEMISLRSKLNETESELEEAQNTLEEAETEITGIREEALAMDEKISQSIAWFTDNSVLPSTLKTDRFISKAENGCISHDKVSLACISYLMAQELDLQYKSDPTGERLYSLEEIIERKGGDCEDYALFFKAALNYLDLGDKGLEAWAPGIGRYIVYEDWSTDTRWYYDDAEGMNLGGADTMKPYAACYFFDTEGTVWEGHCVIMLTAMNISSSKDISADSLSDAVFFEPQDGGYLGRMGAEFQSCEDGQTGCEATPYSISFIITDGDLYEFSDGRWNYYEGYRDRTAELLKKLEGIKTT